jgi:hypothetical protein
MFHPFLFTFSLCITFCASVCTHFVLYIDIVTLRVSILQLLDNVQMNDQRLLAHKIGNYHPWPHPFVAFTHSLQCYGGWHISLCNQSVEQNFQLLYYLIKGVSGLHLGTIIYDLMKHTMNHHGSSSQMKL